MVLSLQFFFMKSMDELGYLLDIYIFSMFPNQFQGFQK